MVELCEVDDGAVIHLVTRSGMSSVDGSRVASLKMMTGSLVGCSRVSGLFVQSVETAGPDGVDEQGPIGFASYCG